MEKEQKDCKSWNTRKSAVNQYVLEMAAQTRSE